MYVSPNFKTKKALKAAVAAQEEFVRNAANMPIGASCRKVEVFAPGLGIIPHNGIVSLEGPHYPEPHRWYAQGTMKDGRLVKVK